MTQFKNVANGILHPSNFLPTLLAIIPGVLRFPHVAHFHPYRVVSSFSIPHGSSSNFSLRAQRRKKRSIAASQLPRSNNTLKTPCKKVFFFPPASPPISFSLPRSGKKKSRSRRGSFPSLARRSDRFAQKLLLLLLLRARVVYVF